jgi:excinuclease ABC subunit A
VRARKGEHVDLLADLKSQGYSPSRVDGEIQPWMRRLGWTKQNKHTIEVVIDRLVAKKSARRRLTDSVETALRLAAGTPSSSFSTSPRMPPSAATVVQ